MLTTYRSLHLRAPLFSTLTTVRGLSHSTPVSLRRVNDDHDESIEEERFPDYRSRRFLPIRPGMKLNNDKYQTVMKLGYGRHLTVWLAEDMTRYVLSE